MDSFREATRVQAERIRNGSLDEKHPGAEQVHRSSWKYLAKVNEKGLITTNSQDAVNSYTGETKSYERAFIEGYMPIEAAILFVDRINLTFEDKIAMLVLSIPKETMTMPDGSIVKGVTIAVTQRFNETTGEWFRSAQMGGFQREEHLSIHKSWWSIPESFQMIGIQVFDTKWGRPARSKNGLFKAVIKTLNSSSLHRPNGIWA